MTILPEMPTREDIARHAVKAVALHDAIHETYGALDDTPERGRRWRDACAAARAHWTPIDDWLEAVAAEGVENAALRDFAIRFLECDPVYFRSGYAKETLLHRLRQVRLGAEERERLRRVLIDAVLRRAGREFRRYCQLAPRVADAEFGQSLRDIAKSDDPRKRRRALWMLDYLGERTHRHYTPAVPGC